MVKEEDEYPEEIAQWLVDLGRRNHARSAPKAGQPPASADELIRYLEELTGRRFSSREDLLRLLKDLWDEDVAVARIAERRRIVREGLLLGVLAVSYLHYYYWDIQLQIAALSTVQVFVSPQPEKSPRRTHSPVRAA